MKTVHIQHRTVYNQFWYLLSFIKGLKLNNNLLDMFLQILIIVKSYPMIYNIFEIRILPDLLITKPSPDYGTPAMAGYNSCIIMLPEADLLEL